MRKQRTASETACGWRRAGSGQEKHVGRAGKTLFSPLLPLLCYRPFLSHSFFLPLSHFPMVSSVSISFPISHSIFRPFSFLCALFLSALFSSPSLLLSRFLIFLPLCFSSISPSSTSLLFSTCFALVHSIRMRINLRKKAFWGQSFASCRRGRRHATSSK